MVAKGCAKAGMTLGVALAAGTVSIAWGVWACPPVRGRINMDVTASTGVPGPRNAGSTS